MGVGVGGVKHFTETFRSEEQACSQRLTSVCRVRVRPWGGLVSSISKHEGQEKVLLQAPVLVSGPLGGTH